MKYTPLEKWHVRAYGAEKDVIVPYDSLIGTERKADGRGGVDEGFYSPERAVYETVIFKDENAAHHFLTFDGVMGLTEIYINKRLVKFHPYGYTSFIADADDYLFPGENKLTVEAENKGQISSRWYTGTGIYRYCGLLTSDEDYIVPDSVFVYTKGISGKDAYLGAEITFYAEKAKDAEYTLTVGERRVNRRVRLDKGETKIYVNFMLHNAHIWSPDDPYIYDVTCELKTDTSKDFTSTSTGIRTVFCDDEKGVLLNGEQVKLYGTCVHHDNGIVGSASFRSAEERRVRILKEAGFNTIRCAHNPPSAVMLDVCDRLGMLVIDELFDVWRGAKKEFDYHLWFEKYSKEDTEATVRRDRNHPSVIFWSTGNEIIEKSGIMDGYHTGRVIAENIRALDPSRPLTHAFCGLWDELENKIENEELSFPAEKEDYYCRRVRPQIDNLDMAGYNYQLWRSERDEIRMPDRLFAMTESFPMDAGRMKRYMDAHPRMCGEFVWTGWDYIGESGIGRVDDTKEGTFWGLGEYPVHIAGCGDIDICGFRKGQSYYREGVWNDGCVRILVDNPKLYGRKHGVSGWGFYDSERSWDFRGYEGKPVTVRLCSLADECELFVNGKSAGRGVPDEDGFVLINTVYEPGVIEAAAYVGGKETFRDTIKSSGRLAKLAVNPDTAGVTGKADILYAEITLTDENGILVTDADDEITVEVKNGTLLGTGSGRIDDTHVYTEPVCRAYHGHILAAVRPDEGTVPVITVKSGDMITEAELR